MDVYLKLDTQPEPADEVLDLLSSQAVVLDQRLLRQPPRLQGWIVPSECDYRPIVRLLVPSVVDAKALTDFVYEIDRDLVVAFTIASHGDLSSAVQTGCMSGTVRIPFKEGVWDQYTRWPGSATAHGYDRRATYGRPKCSDAVAPYELARLSDG